MSLHNLLLFLVYFTHQSLAKPNFTATLFFGDSTLDTGNNNFIESAFRGNHFPYGLDFFPDRAATGRFSDGLIVPDLLTSALDIKPLSPPWLDQRLSDEDIRTGVNFASAGAGMDDLTSAMSNTVPVSRQLVMFGEYVRRLKGVVGEGEGSRILENALVVFSAGGNDVIFNYYDMPSRRRTEFATMSGYQDFLIGKYGDAVKNVYSHGCRRFILTGLPPIGCLPVQMTAATFSDPSARECIDEQMADTHGYNTKLQNLLPKLQQTLPGGKFAYLDITNTVLDMFNDPANGFEETKRGCCGTGLIEMGPLCNHFTPLCENISSFAFFDAIHPTERVYKMVTEHIMNNVIHKLY
ncbi:GDSL esterase/lipase-like [Iris pallida]|uniref:GDSL esterase/lipase-like n=1 Tax=Iris pallida TaxID=29817 RepID=A0AAX6HD76_IRIPA|nr:GDSL esterase/lipase-like [Iris pallida]